MDETPASSTMNHDQGGPRHERTDSADTRDSSDTRSDHSHNQAGLDAFQLTSCALIARPSEWTEELEELGVRPFRRPEALYNALRNREFVPRTCIIDLDWVPRNLVKAVDIRVPCPKLWVGRSASNPADIKNFGVYYSRARPEELNTVMARLVETDRSVMLPAGIVSRQMLPLLAADESYRERLHHYADRFGESNLITIHGDDPVELQLVALYLAVETRRARIWEIKSDTSFHPTLRRIAQARRPGTDVSIILSSDVETGAAREFHNSIPAEYSVIKLAARAENPVGALSFTIPKSSERPRDVANWVTWFTCRASIEYGIALCGLPGLISSITRTLTDNPLITEIRTVAERAVKQHATMMEEHGDYTSYEDLVHNYERAILRQALDKHDGNLSATARSLGLAGSSLRYKLKKLGLVSE